MAGTVTIVESVGYDRSTVDEFVGDLIRCNTGVLVDVCLNALSRRRMSGYYPVLICHVGGSSTQKGYI
jgi:hypothetical protein